MAGPSTRREFGSPGAQRTPCEKARLTDLNRRRGAPIRAYVTG